LVLTLSASLLCSELCSGQPAKNATQAQEADAAFAEGRDLFEQGRFKEACEKFELSLSLDPSPGTLLNLGNCYEPQGDLVRALATFERALDGAQHAADPKRKKIWSEAASERIATLTPRVPVVKLEGVEAGSSLTLDGQALQQEDATVRVNPGEHLLIESADGKLPFEKSFSVDEGEKLALSLPLLASKPVLEAPPTAAPVLAAQPIETKRSGSDFGPWPWITTGTGVGLVTIGMLTGLAAAAKAKQLKQQCDGKQCDPSLKGLHDKAVVLARATDALWLTGTVLVGVGVTLFIVEGGKGSSNAALQAGCFDTGCGLAAHGSF
jgi:tetratricopeptide (TPR) repeat protein